MKWWETKCKEQFPNLYIQAHLNLPLPDSNGSQERTFSAATWMDDKLKKKQSDDTFEMKVLIYKNVDILKRMKVHLDQEQKNLAAASTKKMLQEAAVRRGDDSEEIHREDENLVAIMETEEQSNVEQVARAHGAARVAGV